jgi:sortase A
MEMVSMKRKGKKGLPFMVIGILLLVCALALNLYKLYLDKRSEDKSEEVEKQLSELIEEKLSDEENLQEDVSDQPLYERNPEMAMPVISVDGNDYIGTIEISELDLSLPVLSEWNYPNLNIAPCRYTGTIYMKNMVIAGHNYDSHFGKLKELEVGDSVKFTDTDGNQFFYEVSDLEVLEPTAIEDMKESGYDLTLFTCTYGGKTRYTVRCSLVKTQPAS